MKNRLDFYQVQLQVSNAYTVPFPILITIGAIRIDPHYTFFLVLLQFYQERAKRPRSALSVRHRETLMSVVGVLLFSCPGNMFGDVSYENSFS